MSTAHLQLAFHSEVRVEIPPFNADSVRIPQPLHVFMGEVLRELRFIVSDKNKTDLGLLVKPIADIFDGNTIKFAECVVGIFSDECEIHESSFQGIERRQAAKWGAWGKRLCLATGFG